MLVKKVKLCYVRAVRRLGQGLSDHVVLRKVRLAGRWDKRREVVNGAMTIKSEKRREHQYVEGSVRCHKREKE